MNNRKFCGISLEEIKQYAVVASVLAAILFGGLYNPQVSQAGENLWMYTQGTDTRPKGSTELKWGTIGRFGKYSGDYSFYDHRPEIEYGITDKLTVSGELMIFSHNYSIEDAANAPVSETQSSAEDEGGSCISDPANQYDGCRFNRTSFGGYELGAKYIATGHHAKISRNNRKYIVEKAKDENKDQSYVLFTLKQEQLKRLLFPVGEYTKEEIRDIAKKYNLSHATKPDSQDICFIPKGNYRDFLKDKIKPISGTIYKENGEKVKTHTGIHNFTIGQRKGIEVGGLNEKIYVKSINKENGDVIVSRNSELFEKKF